MSGGDWVCRGCWKGSGGGRRPATRQTTRCADGEGGEVGVGLVGRVMLELNRPGPPARARSDGRIVGEPLVVHREVDRIEAEAVDAAVEPEARGRERRFLHLWVVGGGGGRGG